ncbi:hypothetical protein Bca52824_066492 [Brassica carinata]|uniref:Uncharacterized protein n=1 Tax=Brassica carinata TaxID=52824 RepID=A0A8X7UAP1_BRACI|nr:hypothetical protein Bca52824_066492 [Brassica carinata]
MKIVFRRSSLQDYTKRINEWKQKFDVGEAVPRKRVVMLDWLARPRGFFFFFFTLYPLVDELMEQIKTKDTEIEFPKNDNAEIGLSCSKTE